MPSCDVRLSIIATSLCALRPISTWTHRCGSGADIMVRCCSVKVQLHQSHQAQTHSEYFPQLSFNVFQLCLGPHQHLENIRRCSAQQSPLSSRINKASLCTPTVRHAWPVNRVNIRFAWSKVHLTWYPSHPNSLYTVRQFGCAGTQENWIFPGETLRRFLPGNL